MRAGSAYHQSSSCGGLLKLFSNVKQLKILVITFTGFTVFILEIAMIVSAEPAIMVVQIGMNILDTEFVRAKMLLTKSESMFKLKKGDMHNALASKIS